MINPILIRHPWTSPWTWRGCAAHDNDGSAFWRPNIRALWLMGNREGNNVIYNFIAKKNPENAIPITIRKNTHTHTHKPHVALRLFVSTWTTSIDLWWLIFENKGRNGHIYTRILHFGPDVCCNYSIYTSVCVRSECARSECSVRNGAFEGLAQHSFWVRAHQKTFAPKCDSVPSQFFVPTKQSRISTFKWTNARRRRQRVRPTLLWCCMPCVFTTYVSICAWLCVFFFYSRRAMSSYGCVWMYY